MSKTYHNDERRGLPRAIPRHRSGTALAAQMRHAGPMRHRNERRIKEVDDIDDDIDNVDNIMTMNGNDDET